MSFHEHMKMFSLLFDPIDTISKYSILDAGSGRTSLGCITAQFPNSKIDAIIYPGDKRKRISIESLPNVNYTLLETDICKKNIKKRYDIVVAHLLLGEATKFGNSFDMLMDSLFQIQSGSYAIIDYPQDPFVDFNKIKTYASNHSLTLTNENRVIKEKPFIHDSFTRDYYDGLLFLSSNFLSKKL